MISAPGPRTGVTAVHPGQAAMVAVVVNVPGSDAAVVPMPGPPVPTGACACDKAGKNPAVTAAATPHDAIFSQVTTGV